MQFKEVFFAENFFGVTKSGNGAGNVRGYKRQTMCSGENLLSAFADIGKKGEKGRLEKQ
jgi:hypothetical protein